MWGRPMPWWFMRSCSNERNRRHGCKILGLKPRHCFQPFLPVGTWLSARKSDAEPDVKADPGSVSVIDFSPTDGLPTIHEQVSFAITSAFLDRHRDHNGRTARPTGHEQHGNVKRENVGDNSP